MPLAEVYFGGDAPDIGPGARHPEWKSLQVARGYVRDADAGEQSILAGSDTYAPKPGAMSAEEYRRYLRRPAYYSAVERTADSAVGLAFRSDPEVNAPGVELDDIDLLGNDVHHYARRFCRELLLMGQAAVAVDVASDGRPFLRLYRAEDTFNWVRGLDRELVLAVLHEVAYVSTEQENDPYRLAEEHQLVEYRLEEGALARRWALVKGEWQTAGDQVELTRVGRRLDYLPVRLARGASDGRPPMEALARLAAAHFRLSCDLHHALYWIASPTPYATGMDNTAQKIQVGSTDMLLFSEGVQVGLLEHSGAGVEQMRLQIEHIEEQMAAVGARLLSPPQASAETAETTRLKGLSDTSLLVTAVNEVSAVMTWALQTYAELAGRASDAISYEMDTDFTEPTPSSEPAPGSGAEGSGREQDDGAEDADEQGGPREPEARGRGAVPRRR